MLYIEETLKGREWAAETLRERYVAGQQDPTSKFFAARRLRPDELTYDPAPGVFGYVAWVEKPDDANRDKYDNWYHLEGPFLAPRNSLVQYRAAEWYALEGPAQSLENLFPG